ncbi:glycosyltransferase family 4 protein [Telmatospirillum sp.]|uniref:glycosyltransferase family 4 protein n=1 Tax=Telmatospirillum sp. TaxID=2079197 RepID=UPI00284833AB|nr:glycosyltransferase family 4 protein [Telmatospirillum sp.]MDR3437267.1 glycosyltransferase family 4 protein [Telmatospirillum sp.]
MHVMVVNNLYPPMMAGGAERIVAYLCEGLVRRGHRVTVVSSCGPTMEPYPSEIRNGVEVIRFFPPNLYWSFERSLKPGPQKWLWHARDAWNGAAGNRLRTILAKAQPTILHSHLIDGFSASIWARAQQVGVPVLHTAHDYHLLCPRAFLLTSDWQLCSKPRTHCRLYRNWHLRTTRYVDMFTSPSQFLLDMHSQAGLRAVDRAVVHNGIPLPEDGDKVRQQRSPESRSRFLMLTRLTVEKGVSTVLDAMARLPKDLPIEVAIAGKGPLEDQVRAAAAADSRIHYLGFVDGETKVAAMARAGHLLLPSLWYENAPVAIVEAAAYGLSLIGSDIGGIPEFVEPGQTGFLFPPGDAGALATIMTRLAQDPDALPALAQRSALLARRFTVDRMIDDYETHYATLLDHRSLQLAAR